MDTHRPGRDLINVAKSRTNVIPIIEDARHPLKYRMLVGMVDCVFADDQPVNVAAAEALGMKGILVTDPVDGARSLAAALALAGAQSRV